MKLGSLFDGSGGFPLAGVINGMEPVWASEIEPYPLKVTAARFPNMIQLGDVAKINGAVIEPVDVITFGSPCQDLSVAGKQAGIHDGERSNLFFEAIRIIKEMREHDRRTGRADELCRPRFAVWENVPGAYSSNKGADFQAVLQSICEVTDTGVSVPLPEKGKWKKAGCIVGDGWSIAWRTYDAQYWGVPQRRKRIYLVADFGSERAGEILFERESVCRDTAQGREEGQGTAEDAEGSAGGSDRLKCLNPWDCQSKRIYEETSIWPTIPAMDSGGANNQAVLIDVENRTASPSGTNQVPTTVYCLQGNGIDRALTAGCNGKGWRQNECYTGQDAFNNMLPVIKTDKQHRKYTVRRLTPLECCRLQGFPDWWEEGADGSDSARYKMWGNGIALPCAVDVLSRIANATQNT